MGTQSPPHQITEPSRVRTRRARDLSGDPLLCQEMMPVDAALAITLSPCSISRPPLVFRRTFLVPPRLSPISDHQTRASPSCSAQYTSPEHPNALGTRACYTSRHPKRPVSLFHYIQSKTPSPSLFGPIVLDTHHTATIKPSSPTLIWAITIPGS